MKKIFTLVTILSLLTIVLYTNQTFVKQSSKPERVPNFQRIETDRVTYANLKDLKKDVDIILVGTVERKLDTHNINRNANNGSGFQILGTDYEVSVERYLKGTGTDRIVMIQEGGELNGIIQEIEGRTPITVGNRYILFLKKNDDGKYMFGGDPYKFMIKNGKVKADTDNLKTIEKFKERLEKDFISEVEAIQ